MKNALAFMLLLAACVDADPDVVPAYGPAIPEHENQGQHLLGGLDDYPVDGESFVVSRNGKRGTQNMSVGVDGALLTTSDGLSPVGVTLQTPHNDTLQIVGILPADAEELLRYQLTLSIAGGAPFDPCDGEGAIPIAGHY